jgi:hypothetical protein
MKLLVTSWSFFSVSASRSPDFSMEAMMSNSDAKRMHEQKYTRGGMDKPDKMENGESSKSS